MINEMINGFEPVYSSQSEILILGSFPSVLSRENGFYYGNRRNRFWETVAKIYGKKIPLTNEEKREFVLKNKLALWDVAIKSDIVGSSDSNLKNYEVANLSEVINSSKIRAIICNGKKAYEIYEANFNFNVKVYLLPSTSPANVSFSYEKWENVFKEILNG